VRPKDFKAIVTIVLGAGFVLGSPVKAQCTLEDSNGTLQLHIAAVAANNPTAASIHDLLTGKTVMETEAPLLSHNVRCFYAARKFTPVWSSGVDLLPITEDLVQMLHSLESEGLDPDNAAYHRHRIATLIRQGGFLDPHRLARLDLLLTDAFFSVGHHLHYGVAYGADLNTSNEYNNVPVDMTAVLENAAADGGVKTALLALEPQNREYRALKASLAQYRELADKGGWSTRRADYADQATVRSRLITTGDLNASYDSNATDLNASKENDDRLQEAVKRFQRRHNITADGVVGPVTSSKMAISPEQIIKKIKLNMERWKWLPPRSRAEYIVVNIPGFDLEVMEANTSRLKMQAIVGRRERETPAFASQIRHIVFNPYWRVPETILKEDLIPKLQSDPRYLETKKIRLFAADDRNESRPIDPETVPWKQLKEHEKMRFSFRAEPGEKNPLGYVKFIFPNRHDIYIHDTPSQSLFKNSSAAFSSGCIRIRKPLELAHYLLSRDEPDITYKQIFARMLSGANRWVRLQHPLDVYITYQTARVGEDGRLHLYDDLYGYDKKLENYLKLY
jgi:murein L,D-transpeptidase YcbB/YkuD